MVESGDPQFAKYMYLCNNYSKKYFRKNSSSSFINKFDWHLILNPNGDKIALVSMYFDKTQNITLDLQPIIIMCDIVGPSCINERSLQILKKIYPKGTWAETINTAFSTTEYHRVCTNYLGEIRITVVGEDMKELDLPEGNMYMTIDIQRIGK